MHAVMKYLERVSDDGEDSSRNEQVELLKGCLDNKKWAQDELYTTNSPYLFKICLSYMKDLSLAEELLQDVFLKIYDRLYQLKDPEALESWMKRVCINTALSKLRSIKKTLHSRVDLEEGRFVSDEGNSDVISQFSYDFLLSLLTQITDKKRAVFHLYEQEGYSHQEIVDELGITVIASRSRYFEAKKQVRKLVEEALAAEEKREKLCAGQ